MDEPPKIAEILRMRLAGRVLIVGAGNPLRGDDGAGPALVGSLEGKVGARLLDVGEVPENYLGRITGAEADTIVLVDAVDMGAGPGSLALLEAEDLAGCALSSHQMPMDLVFRYVREQTRADMFAIGIQPARIGFGEPMSPEVADSVAGLAELLGRLLPPAGDDGEVKAKQVTR